jgi:hypothetical protein
MVSDAPVGTAPVAEGVSDAVGGTAFVAAGVSEALSGTAAVVSAWDCGSAAASGLASRIGLRLGMEIGRDCTTWVGCEDLDPWCEDFAATAVGATHVNRTRNAKACARMRVISSVGTGYDPVENKVRTSPEPGSRDDKRAR